VTLRVPEPTAESIEAVQENLSQLAGRVKFRRRALRQANPLDVALAAPHDVYALTLEEVANEASIQDAQPVGRRFLVMEGGTAIASAEVSGRDDGSGFQATEGPFVEATAAAIASAEDDPELADGEYEVRVLRVPALYLMALWLKDEKGDGDVVIPLDPAPEPLSSGKAYAPSDALGQLAEQARERLSFDDVGGGAKGP
jgi:hypothetical protein